MNPDSSSQPTSPSQTNDSNGLVNLNNDDPLISDLNETDPSNLKKNSKEMSPIQLHLQLNHEPQLSSPQLQPHLRHQPQSLQLQLQIDHQHQHQHHQNQIQVQNQNHNHENQENLQNQSQNQNDLNHQIQIQNQNQNQNQTLTQKHSHPTLQLVHVQPRSKFGNSSTQNLSLQQNDSSQSQLQPGIQLQSQSQSYSHSLHSQSQTQTQTHSQLISHSQNQYEIHSQTHSQTPVQIQSQSPLKHHSQTRLQRYQHTNHELLSTISSDQQQMEKSKNIMINSHSQQNQLQHQQQQEQEQEQQEQINQEFPPHGLPLFRISTSSNMNNRVQVSSGNYPTIQNLNPFSGYSVINQIPPSKKRIRQPEKWAKNIKKKNKATSHVTGPDCECKRFKCFVDVTTEEDRKVLIDFFNSLGNYNSQQAYLSSLIEPIQVPETEMSESQESGSPTTQNQSQNLKEENSDNSSMIIESRTTKEEPINNNQSHHSNIEFHSKQIGENNGNENGIEDGNEAGNQNQNQHELEKLTPERDLDSSLTSPTSKKSKKHSYSAKYYIKIRNEKMRVCQKGFCSLFGVTIQRVNLLSGKIFKNGFGVPPTDRRGKHSNRGKRMPNIAQAPESPKGNQEYIVTSNEFRFGMPQLGLSHISLPHLGLGIPISTERHIQLNNRNENVNHVQETNDNSNNVEGDE